MSNSRLDALRMVDPVLTSIAQGFSNPNFIGNKLFPIINVSKMKGKIPVFGREAFAIHETERAIRAASNRVPPPGTNMIYFETKERDLETAIDYLEEEESANGLKYEAKITKDLLDIIHLSHEKEAADLVQNPANYDSTQKLNITADIAFDNAASTLSPITIIWNGKEAIRNRIARYPNVMIIGAASYKALANNTIINNLIKNTDTPYITDGLLKNIFGIENIYVGNAVHSEDGESFTDIWGDNIILAYVDQAKETTASEFNPSFGYTFRREGMPEVDSYYENGGKIKVIRATDNFCLKITAEDAAFLISNTNHNS